MHAQLNAIRRAPRDAEMLDAIAKLGGKGDILRLDAADALGKGALELERNAKRERAQDGELVRGVDALDVEGRVRLRVAERLRLGEHVSKVPALVAHLRQDEIAGAVNDAGDPLDVVGGQPLAQRLDDGNAADDGGLEGHHDATRLRGAEDLVAVHRDQRLVGGDHVLAVGDGAQHQLARRRIAADELDDDVHVRIIDDGKGVVADAPDVVEPANALRVVLARGGMRNADAAPGTARDLRGVAGQDRDGAATDGAKPQESDVHRFHELSSCCSHSGRPVGGAQTGCESGCSCATG